MAKIDKKTTFLFIANNIETTQEHYDNLLEDTSFMYLKYRLYTTVRLNLDLFGMAGGCHIFT